MRNPAVNWTEGMFLCPQHFQAADRYWHELHSLREECDHPYRYGLRKMKYSVEALANSQVALSGLHARFRDGATLAVGVDEELRFDLGQPRPTGPTLDEALSSRESVMAMLAVANANPGAEMVATPGGESPASRYARLERQTVDDTTGDNAQPVSHRRLRPIVLLDTDDTTGFDTLPLFLLRRSATTGKPEVDPAYFPPVLAVSAWSPLSLEIMRKIFDLVSSRMETLAEQVRHRGITFSSHEAGDLQRLLLLQTLNEAVGSLTCLAFGEGVHPFTAYHALCELVGRLSVFGEQRSIDEPPRYDHDDLATIFFWALRQIELLIYDPSSDAYQQRYFVGEGPGLQVALDSTWFDSGWQWYVGARPLTLQGDACLKLFQSGKIDWKLGSTDRVDFLYANMAEGISLSPVPTPRILPSREGWLYFKVARDTPAWQRLKTTRSMAIRINQRLIKDIGALQGVRRLDLVVDGQAVGLEFAVFALSPSAGGS